MSLDHPAPGIPPVRQPAPGRQRKSRSAAMTAGLNQAAATLQGALQPEFIPGSPVQPQAGYDFFGGELGPDFVRSNAIAHTAGDDTHRVIDDVSGIKPIGCSGCYIEQPGVCVTVIGSQ